MNPPTNPTCFEQLVAILSAILLLIFPLGQSQQALVEPNATTYQIVLVPGGTGVNATAMSEAADVIAARLQALEVSDIGASGAILRSDAAQIEIRLMLTPDRTSDDPAAFDNILSLLTAPGVLEFVDFSAVNADDFGLYENTQIATSAYPDRAPGDVFPTVFSNADIQSADAIYEASFVQWIVQVELTPAAAATLGAFTEANQLAGLAIVLDGVVLSIPIVQGRLTTPVVIALSFSEAEARTLAVQLNSRPLPIPLVVESVEGG